MARTYEMSGIRGESTLTPPLASYVNSYALTANVALTITWPAGYKFCNIVGDGAVNYYVCQATTATVPSTTVETGLASARNVAQRQRLEETSFSVIAASNTVLTVEFWLPRS